MSTENKAAKLSPEIIEKVKATMDSKLKDLKPSIRALDDEELDSVSGGYFDSDVHDYEASARLDDGTILYQYFGVDTCSFCTLTQQTRFYQMPIDGVVYVMCAHCAMKSSAN